MSEFEDIDIVSETSTAKVNNVQVVVTSGYNTVHSNILMSKHCFIYTIHISNLFETKNIKLISCKFKVQVVSASEKHTIGEQELTGRQPSLKPGESFAFSNTA